MAESLLRAPPAESTAPTVLHVVNCLTLGGSERQLLTLMDALGRVGVGAKLAYLQPGRRELGGLLQAKSVPYEEFPLRGSLLSPNTLWQAGRLAAWARGVRLVHAHDLYANALGLLAARLLRVPCVISRRDMADWRPANQRRLLRLLSRAADGVLVNARAIATLTIEEGAPPERVCVVPNGLDLTAFDAEARREPDPPLPPRRPGVTRLAMVGNLDRPHKGHGELLEAAVMLRARGHRLDWLLPSDGPLRPQLEARARALGLGDTVHFLGRRNDLPRVLVRVDGLVHPSWSEGFPNVVMEALAVRLPVVATNVGGCPDLIEPGQTGWLVQPRDPTGLAAAIEQLLADPERARAYGRTGRQRLQEGHDLAALRSRVLGLYDRALTAVTGPKSLLWPRRPETPRVVPD